MKTNTTKTLLTTTVALPTLGLLLITGLSFFGQQNNLFELMSHFRAQYIVLFLISAISFAFLNRKWLVVALTGLLTNVFSLAPIYIPRAEANIEIETRSPTNRLSLVFANVLVTNRDHERLISSVTSRDADLIVLQEVNERWLRSLRSIDADYPYQKLIPRQDNFGIAIYSKFPLQDISVEDFVDNNLPSISVSIAIKNKKVRIIAVHPRPPISNAAASEQSLFFEMLAKAVLSQSGPVIVVGDLNSSLTSPRYKKLIQQTGLVNARQGKGIYPTWWPYVPMGRILGIPIDHVLISSDLDAVNFATLAQTGADHLPIFAEIAY